MARFFNNREIELLAPSGNFGIFKEIIDTPCDAVYLGGKTLNMRLHRKGYNFSNAELSEAVAITHEKGKKIYITVNNLHDGKDLSGLTEYLCFLDEIKPDAIIVQDMSVICRVRALGLGLGLHASVMMDVHNFDTVRALRGLGVSRVIMSRECGLERIKAMSFRTDMAFEYFIHGDMCAAHGAHCYYSSVLFGKSSNRGLCLKPCRWAYKLAQGGKLYDPLFPIAAKDMCMYEHMPELIHSNISSFKIEGRMRGADYLKMLIGLYADAIDRYIQDPLHYDRQKDSATMFENRKRDMSTLYAFGDPGLSHINTRYEGTGALYSSGKMFSDATDERAVTEENTRRINAAVSPHMASPAAEQSLPRLSVHVNSVGAALKCAGLGVERIYLSEPFSGREAFGKERIEELIRGKKNSEIYLALPFPMYDECLDEYEHFLAGMEGVDGLLVTTLGAVERFKGKGFKLSGDYSLNIYNAEAAQAYLDLGLSDYAMSIEPPAAQAAAMLAQTGGLAEMLVWGAPAVMIFGHDLSANAEKFPGIEDGPRGEGNILPPSLYLVDGRGNGHPVYRTRRGRYNMLTYRHICLLPVLDGLRACGLRNMRLECLDMPDDMTEAVVKIYRSAVGGGDARAAFEAVQGLYPALSYGALEFHQG